MLLKKIERCIKMKSLTIGKIATLSNIGVETIRYYEREKLINSPPRNSSGYRQYPIETIDRIKFIKNAKESGFTLKEIKELLNLKLKKNGACDKVKKQAELKLFQVEEKIISLKNIKTSLKKLIEACSSDGTKVGACPILENFEKHQESQK